jgi:hypothetical protein
MAKITNLKGLFTLVASRNKNSKAIERGKVKPKMFGKLRGAKASNKRSAKGEPMSNPLSYPEQIGYNY